MHIFVMRIILQDDDVFIDQIAECLPNQVQLIDIRFTGP